MSVFLLGLWRFHENYRLELRGNNDLNQIAIAAKKVLKKKLFTKKMFWRNSFRINYKTITLQSKVLGLFSCKKGHASDSNIRNKIFL